MYWQNTKSNPLPLPRLALRNLWIILKCISSIPDPSSVKSWVRFGSLWWQSKNLPKVRHSPEFWQTGNALPSSFTLPSTQNLRLASSMFRGVPWPGRSRRCAGFSRLKADGDTRERLTKFGEIQLVDVSINVDYFHMEIRWHRQNPIFLLLTKNFFELPNANTVGIRITD